MERFSPRVERLLVAGALGCAFILMASVFRPHGTIASPGQTLTENTEDAARSAEMPSLGELIGRDHTVTILVTEDGPRFTVRTLGGVVVGEALTAEEAESIVDDPQLQHRLADYIIGTGLMLADPVFDGCD